MRVPVAGVELDAELTRRYNKVVTKNRQGRRISSPVRATARFESRDSWAGYRWTSRTGSNAGPVIIEAGREQAVEGVQAVGNLFPGANRTGDAWSG